MDVLKLTTADLASAKRQPNRPLAVPAAVADGPSVRRRTLDGVAWTYRRESERLFESVKAHAWARPDQQDWTLVKRNGRREVWRAELFGRTYYVKYYREHTWAVILKNLVRSPVCETEWNGGLFALRAGIPAAVPAGYAARLQRGGRMWAVLVTEAVQHAFPLNEFWLQVQKDPDLAGKRRDAEHLIEQLAEMLARAHQAGFEHLDMHAANILVQPTAPRVYRTVFIDLQTARLDRPVTDHAVVRNLAQLNQWFRKNSSVGDRLRFLRAYLRWRNEFEGELEHARPLGLDYRELVAALSSAALRHADRLGSQRDRRSTRNGSYFSRLSLPNGWRGVALLRCKHDSAPSRASRMAFSREWWVARIGDPLRWFGADQGEACKLSHSGTVRRALLEHETTPLPVILKRPLARSWRRRIAQLFSVSRSMRGWKVGHALLNRDVPTARPLAVLERKLGPLTLDSVLISEAVVGAIDLESHLRTATGRMRGREWLRHKLDLTQLVVQHIRRLHERGFAHRDCKASNVLLISQPEPQLMWIDMDGIRRVREVSTSQIERALVRLHVSLLDVPGLTRTDRVRFLKLFYARFGASPDEWRRVYLALAADAARKADAKARRRSWKLAHYGRE